jgi:hypothetical protein
VQSIRCWLERMGRERYPEATELTITADCGGSNGTRVRLWKVELQKLANETGLVLHVHHYPPGTSKWNKIEHSPLLPHHAELAGAAADGSYRCRRVDWRDHHESRLESRVCTRHPDLSEEHQDQGCRDGSSRYHRRAFHPEWNYTINPRRR